MPFHIGYYGENTWDSKPMDSDLYDVIDKYPHPFIDEFSITILINKETYEPYSCSKSANN